MKLCFIASRLFSGGFTTSMLAMMNQLSKEGNTCDLVFLDSSHHERPISLVQNYHVINVQNQERSHFNFVVQKKIKELKKKIADIDKKTLNRKEQNRRMMMSVCAYVLEWLPVMDLSAYDCVISWEEITCNYFLAYNVKARRKVAYIHPDYILSAFDKETDFPALGKMDCIVSVSEATTATLKKVFPEYHDRIRYVPNVLDVEEIHALAKMCPDVFPKSSFDIVTVCRLSIYHKGLDRLMKTASRLKHDGFAYQWYICGEGEGRKQLEKMIRQDHLDCVHLMGDQKNPYPYMKKADLFCLFSNYEGKPVVVDEALCIGTPVFVTNYASAKEQVSDQEGFVVPIDDDAVYEKMKWIMENPDVLMKLRENLQQTSDAKYTDTSAFMQVVRK